jgi:hypothetical protein
LLLFSSLLAAMAPKGATRRSAKVAKVAKAGTVVRGGRTEIGKASGVRGRRGPPVQRAWAIPVRRGGRPGDGHGRPGEGKGEGKNKGENKGPEVKGKGENRGPQGKVMTFAEARAMVSAPPAEEEETEEEENEKDMSDVEDARGGKGGGMGGGGGASGGPSGGMGGGMGGGILA